MKGRSTALGCLGRSRRVSHLQATSRIVQANRKSLFLGVSSADILSRSECDSQSESNSASKCRSFGLVARHRPVGASICGEDGTPRIGSRNRDDSASTGVKRNEMQSTTQVRCAATGQRRCGREKVGSGGSDFHDFHCSSTAKFLAL